MINYILLMIIAFGVVAGANIEASKKTSLEDTILCVAIAPLCIGLSIGVILTNVDKNIKG